MNESDFENELRTLRPIAPAADLEERIATELVSRQIAVAAPRAVHVPLAGVLARPAAPSLVGRLIRGLGWACAGAAAAIAAITWIHHPAKIESRGTQPEVAAVGTDGFEPTTSERELVNTEDQGLLYVDGEEPVRQIRYSYVERYAWTNPATGARVEVEVPREDVLLTPVAMQ